MLLSSALSRAAIRGPGTSNPFLSSTRRTLTNSPSVMRTTLPTLKNSVARSAIFEIQITPVFSHYKNVTICLLRNAFQTFRPLLITMVMGNMLKVAAFALQFPISFYSIFFFEVLYGMMQLAVSFVFVCLFHNNIMFRRVCGKMTSGRWPPSLR